MPQTATSRSIDLALQGGGSHGAFTWGVLDRLLEHEDVDFGGLSGTSAGAMNAVVMVSGWAASGRQGARDALNAFWEDVGRTAEGGAFGPTPFQLLFGHHWNPVSYSPYQAYDVLSRMFSPYQLNPFNLNPLRDVLDRHVNFTTLRQFDAIKVFISATNVRTGRPRIFRNAELSRDAVLASACLPLMFHAVEIEGESYWDGGYTGNPTLLPLIAESRPGDLMLVQINPVERSRVPRTAQDIVDRINEVSFNSSLVQELRSIALVKRLLVEESSSGHSYEAELFRKIDALNLHRIEAHKDMRDFGATSRLNAKSAFIRQLHDIGYQAADQWLEQHFEALGTRSTVDLLGEYAQTARFVE